jgi:hypothetical protein
MIFFVIVCAIACANASPVYRLKNTFIRMKQFMHNPNMTETMFAFFCLEPNHEININAFRKRDEDEPIQVISIKMRYVSYPNYSDHTGNLFCVPLDYSSNIP